MRKIALLLCLGGVVLVAACPGPVYQGVNTSPTNTLSPAAGTLKPNPIPGVGTNAGSGSGSGSSQGTKTGTGEGTTWTDSNGISHSGPNLNGTLGNLPPGPPPVTKQDPVPLNPTKPPLPVRSK